MLKSKESATLLQELELYLARVVSYPDFESKREFLDEFKSIRNAVLDEIADDANWEKQYEACLRMQTFFRHGMCSRWEFTPSELSEDIGALIEATNSYLRLCYKGMGNEKHNINPSELFEIGDEVYLVQKELMHLSNFGSKEYVDSVTRHIYTVKKVLDNDISNMPQYIIESGNFSRLARHNALAKATPL